MNIRIHRGLDQVGGCITEISTDTSRVFIDFGQNLPGVGEPTTEEEDRKMVEQILKQNEKAYQAVFYTHAHSDHVGLYHHIPKHIPQYIGEGAKEILLTKHYFLKKVNELSMAKAKESGDENEVRKCLQNQQSIEEKLALLKLFRTWKRTAKPERKHSSMLFLARKRSVAPESIEIGDIRITPFFNCHSIYDSYMFLIEADGKRIWHMGDYREHGYMGKGLFPTLQHYATDIDVLITEGTMLNREDICIHEADVSKKMSHVMQAFKYVFVLASSTDIERLAAINNAALTAKKRLHINSGMMKAMMKVFTEREAKNSNGLFSFHPEFISEKTDWKKLMDKGFVLVTGASKYDAVKDMLSKLPASETLLIYSSWDGYYKDTAQVAINPNYKLFREAFQNVVDIHTPGHADRKTIEKVIKTVTPKEVICIHKEAGATL